MAKPTLKNSHVETAERYVDESDIIDLPIEPLRDRVVIRPDQPAGSVGRILLPDSAKSKPMIGTVLAVGPGDWMLNKDKDEVDAELTAVRRPMSVVVGDRVVYAPYANSSTLDMLEEDYKECIIIPEAAILAKIV